MSFTLIVSPEPRRYLERLDERSRKRFLRKFRELSTDPFHQTKTLQGVQGLRSARVGGWRVLYTVDLEAQTISIDHIAPRGQVYRGL